MRRPIALVPLIMLVAAGCGGDGDDAETSSPTPVGTIAATPEDAADIPAPGDPCDGNDYGRALEWPPNLDCDDEAGEVVAAGEKCSRPVGTSITTLAEKLKCETGRKWEDGKWIRYDPSMPDKVNPSVPIEPVQEGDPCVPGEELPPGYVCE